MAPLSGSDMDMLKSLAKAPKVGKGNGWTTRELCSIWRCADKRARSIIQRAIQDGRMAYSPVRRTNMCGVSAEVPGYVMVDSKTKKA